MIVKKYKAPTEKEAVMAAKEDLGSNAVVLNVKTMKQRGISRVFKKDYVEITAALEEKEFEQKVVSRNHTFEAAADEKIKIPDRAVANAIEEKLDNLHNMLQNRIVKDDIKEQTDVGKNTEEEKKNTNANFKSLKLIYGKLLENEVDEKYVNGIINDIETSIKKEANLDSILASVYQKIILKLGEPETIKVGNRKKIVFFVGPTGVGKTTTIAKLASEYKLKHNRKIAFITADVYRIAAVEQLNTYAAILDVPVNVIYSPSEIVDNIKELEEYDMIMVDTAGRSHKNQEQRDELFELVNNVRQSGMELDTDVFLVLSVTTKYRDLINITNAYKELDNYRLLFTKLDETGAIGNIMNMRCYTGAPLSYVTSGQNVPDDIELADVQKLAKMLLGGE